MKNLLAFIKKECMEQLRSGRLLITLALFILLGIMNPAIAKLTPWMLDLMAESLKESGITVSGVVVSAMDSWVQFFKNLPIAMVAFVLLQGSVFTKEYESGTLLLSLTKGLSRPKVLISKAILLLVVWSVGYWLCFIITYLYNMYFWDNSVAQSLLLSVLCWWIFGLFIISIITLFSTLSSSNVGVLCGVGAVVLISSVVGLIPKISKYFPTMLTDGNSLIYGVSEAKDYIAAIIVTVILTVASFAVSIPIFNKKQL